MLLGAILLLGMQIGAPAEAQSFAVGLVTDPAGLNDAGFNWFSYQGLLRAESELEVEGTVYTSTGTAHIGPNLQQCVDDGNDLCISVGFFPAEAISKTAASHPGTLFAIVDTSWESYPANLRGMIFANGEVGYLAGILAGLMTQSDVVGSVAGMQILPVEALAEPYRNAAQCVNPNLTAIITYTGTFGDPILGAQVAQDQIAQGADILFGVGALTGNSAVLTATQSGAWGIGVDTDQYLTLFRNGAVPGSNRLLSSAMKRMDNAVFDTISNVVAGTFTSGTVLYGLAVDGVALAPFHEADPFVSPAIRGRLERIKRYIIDGAINVYGPCPALYYPTQTVVTLEGMTVLTDGGGVATATFAPNTFTETAVVTYSPQLPVETGPGLAGIGLFFELTAASQATGADLQPQRTYSITVSYLDQEVQAAGIANENALGLYYWEGNHWVREPSSIVDTAGNLIGATPDHFSLWALLAPTQHVFLPLVARD